MTTLRLINGFSISSNMDQNSLLRVWTFFVIIFQSASSASVGQDDSIKTVSSFKAFEHQKFNRSVDKIDLTKRDSHYLEKIKEFKYIVSGFDYEDRPVLIMNWGKWDVIWLTNYPEEKNQFITNYNNLLNEIESGVFFRKLDKFLPTGSNYTSTNQYVTIKNYDGFNLRTMYKPAAVKLQLGLLANMQAIIDKLAYGVIINANPVVNQFLAMAKPVAGNFLAKLDVYGTNSDKWIPRIRSKIPPDQLPYSMGGNKDFKPLYEQSLIH